MPLAAAIESRQSQGTKMHPRMHTPAEPMARGLRPAAAASMREVCTPEGGVLGCRPQLHFITLPPRACTVWGNGNDTAQDAFKASSSCTS